MLKHKIDTLIMMMSLIFNYIVMIFVIFWMASGSVIIPAGIALILIFGYLAFAAQEELVEILEESDV